MAKRPKREHLESSGRVDGKSNTNHMLEIFFALDRMVVEFSMLRYSVSRRDRNIMREQNQRLHDAFREHLPRMLDLSRSSSQG